MCESCQRPASNGIIVPRDSGPLTTSALEKSQKQTAQCKQEQPGAAVPGQSSQVRRPAAEAVSAAPGPDQTPRRPQHDPPRRSGTVDASCSLSLSVLHCWGSRVQAAVPSARETLQRASGFAGKRSLLGSVPVHSAGAISRRARCRAELVSSFRCQGNVWVCKYRVPRLWKTSRWDLRRGVVDESPFAQGPEPVPSGSSPGHWQAQGAVSRLLPGPRAAPRFVYYLLHKGFAGRMGIFKAICFSHVL